MLTSVTFPKLVTVYDIEVEENQALVDFRADKLKICYELSVTDNPALESISLKSLMTVRTIDLSYNPHLSVAAFHSLMGRSIYGRDSLSSGPDYIDYSDMLEGSNAGNFTDWFPQWLIAPPSDDGHYVSSGYGG